MKIKSNHHSHTTMVDGRSTAEEMVLAAIDAGLDVLGFSEHGSQSFDQVYALNDITLSDYISEVRRLKDKYSGKITIRLGIELDSEAVMDLSPFEYVVGGVHYFKGDDWFYSVDSSLEDLTACCNMAFDGDGNRMAIAYYKNLSRFVSDVRPDVIAHFDLIRKFNRGIYDLDNPGVRAAAMEALDSVRSAGTILEVNTGGMARAALPNPYPEEWILKKWLDMGGKVIVGSDCHYAPQIAYAFPQALDLIRKTGFSSIMELGREDEPLFVERTLN